MITTKINWQAIAMSSIQSIEFYSINHLFLVHLFVGFPPEFPLDRHLAVPNETIDLIRLHFAFAFKKKMREMMIDTSVQSSSSSSPQSIDCLLLVPISVNIVCISFKNSLQFLRSSAISCFNSLTTIRWFWRSCCTIFINFRTNIRLLGQKIYFFRRTSSPVTLKRDRIVLCNRISLCADVAPDSAAVPLFSVWSCTIQCILRPYNSLPFLWTENYIVTLPPSLSLSSIILC